jgi:hypothetical protein
MRPIPSAVQWNQAGKTESAALDRCLMALHVSPSAVIAAVVWFVGLISLYRPSAMYREQAKHLFLRSATNSFGIKISNVLPTLRNPSGITDKETQLKRNTIHLNVFSLIALSVWQLHHQ